MIDTNRVHIYDNTVLVVLAIFPGDLLVTIRMVQMAEANYDGDIYFVRLLKPLVQKNILAHIVSLPSSEVVCS